MHRLLLSPGPVETPKHILKIGSEPLDYFRGDIFAQVMKDLTEDIKYLFQTTNTPITLTASGSGAMDMALHNLFEDGDTVIVINGGSFGKKWVAMCNAYRLNIIEFTLEPGTLPDMKKVDEALAYPEVKGLLINMHETSTGVLYDIDNIGKLTKNHDKLFIVDGISSIGADTFLMDAWHCDCAMVSSNKALACMPGLSFIAFSPKALEVIKLNTRPKYYFDALDYLKNITRGMTPFTPAMNIIMQVKATMKEIREIGIEEYNQKHAKLADTLRALIDKADGYSVFGDNRSNALTTIQLPPHIKSQEVISHFREERNIELAPIPLDRTDLLRVSHMGNLTQEHMIYFFKELTAFGEKFGG